LATAGSAAVEDDVPALADEVPLAAADDDVLLLLPHPAMMAAARSRITTNSQLFRAGMALLLIRFTQKTWARICNIAFTSENFGSWARTSNPAPTLAQGGASLGSMQVRIRLFAGLRERAGTDAVELELPDGARVGDALERMADLTAGVPVVLAVNREYATAEEILTPGDELALIPPVSGGSVDVAHVRVTSEALKPDALVERVRDPRAGAVVTFLGVTREVPALRYEAYAEMAEAKMQEIVTAAIEAHGLCAAAAEHRMGEVPLSEASVAIAASAPHRAEAFAGARQIIDEIKAQAPIWKKEEGEWVDGVRPS
jgi:molybdopterin synthase catalytic subunit